MPASTANQRRPIKDLRKVFHYTDTMTRKPTRDNDPYEYMAGFGNRFQSEVIPGTLPAGQNNPQEPRFGLYTEGLTYSAFTAPRNANFSTYMYRVRPAAAHSMDPIRSSKQANVPDVVKMATGTTASTNQISKTASSHLIPK